MMRMLHLVLLLCLFLVNTGYAAEYNQEDLMLELNGNYYVYKDKNTGKHISGLVREHYKNGALRSEGAVQDGLRSGVKREYSPDGKLTSTTEFAKGLRDGVRKEYRPNGTLKAMWTYSKHSLHGTASEYDGNGTLVAETVYVNGKAGERKIATAPSPGQSVVAVGTKGGGKEAGSGLPKTATNSIGTEFVLIPAGSFMMGSADGDRYSGVDEKPAHRVTISQPFYLGKYEVTQGEWEAVMGNNPSEFKGRSNPVEKVSWNKVQTFIERLNQKEGTNRYRLPTEAEWEYAARAGTTTRYSYGNDENGAWLYAWGRENSGDKTHPVGQKEPNPWGLYDMHGNVWEWVQDWYGFDYYAQSPATDPRGPSGSWARVVRGGGWFNFCGNLLSASRNSESPDSLRKDLGFRLAFSPDSP